MKRLTLFMALIACAGWMHAASWQMNDADSVTWNILQTPDSLQEGVKVLFGNAAKDYVLGLYNYDVSKSNILGVAATYGEQRHTVTASRNAIYTVHRSGDTCYFEGTDGKYLYMYNTSKNLSSSTTLNKQAKWIVTIKDSKATIKSTYSSSWAIYFNKTAAKPMYCTYQSVDANLAEVLLYTDNAPEWKAPEKHPELTLLNGTDTIRGLLDWGKVIYDDSWGTEYNPYEESKTITVIAKDLSDSIYFNLAKGVDFTSYTSALSTKGGKVTIQFSVASKGSYQDTLFVRCGEIKDTIVLKAQAVKEEEVKPSITFSARQVNLRADSVNNFGDIASFTFSTQNLVKNLYIKWENSTGNSIPQGESDVVEILAGEEYVYYGQSTNMGSTDQTNTEVIVDLTAYTSGTYTSTLLFFTPDADDKSKNAFEERVTITIVVDNGEPTSLDSSTVHPTPYTKHFHNDQLLIYHNGKWYTVNGQIVNK